MSDNMSFFGELGDSFSKSLNLSLLTLADVGTQKLANQIDPSRVVRQETGAVQSTQGAYTAPKSNKWLLWGGVGLATIAAFALIKG